MPWHNIVRWTRQDLFDSGHIISPKRGVWKISDSGMKLLDEADAESIGRGVFRSDKFIDPETFERRQQEAKRVGELGEKYVLGKEIEKLNSWGREDLAARVRHISQENVAAGYDILSFDSVGNKKHIEVKTTKLAHGSFILTNNEYQTAKQLGKSYWIYRVTKVESDDPGIQTFQDPAWLIREKLLLIKPTAYSVNIADT